VCVAQMGETRKTFRVLVGKPEGKGPQEVLSVDCSRGELSYLAPLGS